MSFPFSTQLLKETNSSNYGHNTLIWEDTSNKPFDFKLPPKGEIRDKYGDSIYGSSQYGSGGTRGARGARGEMQYGGAQTDLKHEYIEKLLSDGDLIVAKNQKNILNCIDI